MGSINSDIFTAIESIPLMFTVIINASIILVICVDIYYQSIKTSLYLFLHRNFVVYVTWTLFSIFSFFGCVIRLFKCLLLSCYNTSSSQITML